MNKTATTGREHALLKTLASGKTLTVKQIRQQFKLKNPSAAIDRFVKKDINVQRVYTTKKTRINGLLIPITTVKYAVIPGLKNKSKKK